MALAANLRAYLDQMRPYFVEKGMVRIWNDIDKFGDSAAANNVTFAGGVVEYGDVKLNTAGGQTSDVNPAFLPSNGDTTEGRDGTGGRYAHLKFPVAGFRTRD